MRLWVPVLRYRLPGVSQLGISEPVSDYVYTDVFPTSCGSFDPPGGWSELDPDSGEYIFCSTYAAGDCQDGACIRFWVDNEGPCDPEVWWRFHQNYPGFVVSTNPPDCAIDARQPSATDCTDPCGVESIEMTFDGDASCVTKNNFNLRLVPAGNPPGIGDMIVTGSTTTLVLDNPIPPGHWICLEYTHMQSPEEVCLGRLPADVNGDRTAAPSDILYLIDCLNGIRSCEMWQCDTDCSDVCAPPDILRVIDLLNGAGCYEPWLNVSTPPCPTAP